MVARRGRSVHGQVVDAGSHAGPHVDGGRGSIRDGGRRIECGRHAGRSAAQTQVHRPVEIGPLDRHRGGVAVALDDGESRGVERERVVRRGGDCEGQRRVAVAGRTGSADGQVVDPGGHEEAHGHRERGAVGRGPVRNEGAGDPSRGTTQAQRHRPGEVGARDRDRRGRIAALNDGERRGIDRQREVRRRCHRERQCRGAVAGRAGPIHGQVVDAGRDAGAHRDRKRGAVGRGRVRNEGAGDAGRSTAQTQVHRTGEVGPGDRDRRRRVGILIDGERRRIESRANNPAPAPP